MAPLASRTNSIWDLLIENTPGRLAYAVRVAAICTVVAIVTQVYTTPEAAVTIYIVFFLNKRDRTSSVALAIALVVIFTLVIGLLLWIATPVLQNPAYRVATMALISIVLLFLVSASKLRVVGGTVALIIAYALDVLGSAPFGEIGTRVLLYAWLFVGIPAAVSCVVNLLSAPSPRSIVQEEIATLLRAGADALINTKPEARSRLARLIAEGDEESQELLKLSAIEKTSPADDIAALRGAISATTTVVSAVDIMVNEDGASLPRTVRTRVADTLSELAEIFETGAYPALVEPLIEEPAATELARCSITLFNRGLKQFGELRPPAPASQKSPFLSTDTFTNPEHIQFALKSTAAAMFCYLTYSLLSWPGIHTAMITCYIVSLGTAAESVEKLTLRIIGCLAGAGVGLAVMLRIIPFATDVGHLAAIVFAGTLVAAWVAAGSPRVAYAGFQFAFAYFLCIIQGNSASFNMVVARDRVIGILFGNLVSYLVLTRVWPSSIAPRVDAALEKARQQFIAVGRTRDHSELSHLTAETHGLLHRAEQDLHLLAYEPLSLRPAAKWIKLRLQAVRDAQRLASPLLAAAELEDSGALHRSTNILSAVSDAHVEGSPRAAGILHENSLEDVIAVRALSFRQALHSRAVPEEHA